MQYVELVKGGPMVSRFGMGALRLPRIKDDEGNDVVDVPASIAMVRKAIDGGINFFDTAHSYGRSEEILGYSFKDGYREKVIICTKLPIAAVKCKEDLQRFFDEELSRLQTDHIDVYLLHNLSKPNWDIAVEHGALEFMQNLKKEGKVSYIGFSFHDNFEHFKMVVDNFPSDVVMLQYNYFDKYNQATVEGVKYAAERGMAVLTMESLHSGMLANNVPEEVKAAFGDWNSDKNDAEKAFMWLYNQPEVTVILSGIGDDAHLEEDFRIFKDAKSGILAPEDEKYYDAARKAWGKFVNINCTACAYCMPCPMGVDIPQTFKFWNEQKLPVHQKWLYESMVVNGGKGAEKCIECGVCMPKCPQNLDIPAGLRQAHEEMMPKPKQEA